MLTGRLWDVFVDALVVMFMPALCSYHIMCGNLFVNVAAQNATGFEKAGNTLLIPFHYLFAGRAAVLQDEGSWVFVQRFDYNDAFWIKTGASVALAAPSLVLGSAVKAIGYLSQETRSRHASLLCAKTSTQGRPNLDLYRQWGIALGEGSPERFESQGYLRRPGDENLLGDAKEGLADIASALNDAQIPWWADCGTCLGIYRYGGVIPWDDDIDIAILVTDFENARRALNRLDPKKYIVKDWSSRSFPDTFFKICVQGRGTIIDIFCFDIDPEKRQIKAIFSHDQAIFFPEWFKIRERRFTVPTDFALVFPLKKASFDGIEVFVPNRPKEYLQRVYGENLGPAKIYNSNTGFFEKDPAHPYWQIEYVH